MKRNKKYTKCKRKNKKLPKLNDGGYIYDDTKSEFANYIAQNQYLADKQNEALDTQFADVEKGIEAEMEKGGVSATKGALSGASTGMSIAGPWGALAGGVIGAGASLFTSSRRNVERHNTLATIEDEKNKQKREIEERNKKIQSDSYNKIVEDYNTKGNKNIQYFENGGNLAVPNVYAKNGGKLQELSSNVDIIKGKTHKQGGVDLAVNGKVIAEGENKEVIKDDNMVYSHKLGYAKEAEKLAKQKAKYEKDLKSIDTHKRNTALRTVEGIDKKLDELFTLQELNKNNNTIKMANGGELSNPPKQSTTFSSSPLLQASTLFNKINTSNRAKLEYDIANPSNDRFGDYEYPEIEINKLEGLKDIEVPEMTSWEPTRQISRKETMKLADGGQILAASQFALPLIENAYNAKLIQETPQLSRHKILNPQLQKAEELETEYNINPQLADIDTQSKRFNTAIDRGTNNANVGRANKIAAHIRTIEQKNKLRGQKENIETDLRNKNKLNRQQVEAQNLALINKYDQYNAENEYADKMLEFKRKDEIAGRKSENVARLTEDLMTGVKAMNQYKLDNRKIDLDMMKYNTGIQSKMLNDSEFVNQLKSDKNRQNAFKDMIKDRPNAVEQWNKLFPDNMIFNEKLKKKYIDDTKNIKGRQAQPIDSSNYNFGSLAIPTN